MRSARYFHRGWTLISPIFLLIPVAAVVRRCGLFVHSDFLGWHSMHSDRAIVLIRQVNELASKLSELESLRNQVAEAQQRALASTIPSGAMMKVPPKLVH